MKYAEPMATQKLPLPDHIDSTQGANATYGARKPRHDKPKGSWGIHQSNFDIIGGYEGQQDNDGMTTTGTHDIPILENHEELLVDKQPKRQGNPTKKERRQIWNQQQQDRNLDAQTNKIQKNVDPDKNSHHQGWGRTGYPNASGDHSFDHYNGSYNQLSSHNVNELFPIIENTAHWNQSSVPKSIPHTNMQTTLNHRQRSSSMQPFDNVQSYNEVRHLNNIQETEEPTDFGYYASDAQNAVHSSNRAVLVPVLEGSPPSQSRLLHSLLGSTDKLGTPGHSLLPDLKIPAELDPSQQRLTDRPIPPRANHSAREYEWPKSGRYEARSHYRQNPSPYQTSSGGVPSTSTTPVMPQSEEESDLPNPAYRDDHRKRKLPKPVSRVPSASSVRRSPPAPRKPKETIIDDVEIEFDPFAA
jgi:hypothetical protein